MSPRGLGTGDAAHRGTTAPQEFQTQFPKRDRAVNDRRGSGSGFQGFSSRRFALFPLLSAPAAVTARFVPQRSGDRAAPAAVPSAARGSGLAKGTVTIPSPRRLPPRTGNCSRELEKWDKGISKMVMDGALIFVLRSVRGLWDQFSGIRSGTVQQGQFSGISSAGTVQGQFRDSSAGQVRQEMQADTSASPAPAPGKGPAVTSGLPALTPPTGTGALGGTACPIPLGHPAGACSPSPQRLWGTQPQRTLQNLPPCEFTAAGILPVYFRKGEMRL